MTAQKLQGMSPSRTEFFGQAVCVGREQDLSRTMDEQLAQGRSSVFFCNVHMLMLAREDAQLASAMQSADLVMPDGVPVAWLQRRLGHPEAAVFRGETALELVCHRAAVTNQPVGFYGSTNEVMEALVHNLRGRYPKLRIEYAHSPPMMSEEIQVDPAVVHDINSHNLFCLFIGLGCPKQEKWVLAYAGHLNCNLLAVGAVFDWVAGTVRQPPAWATRSGLAWLYRLLQDPRRMWYRYLKFNSKFVLMAAKLLIYDRRVPTSGNDPRE